MTVLVPDPLTQPGSRYRAGGSSEIAEVARRWLAGSTGIYFAPNLPPLKEAGLRAAHGAYLPESEPVVVLYDATLLGTGENGFAVTAERLCWKNLLDHPRQIAWSEVDPTSIAAHLAGVDIAGGNLAVSGDLSSAVAGFLEEMTRRCRPEQGGPYRRGVRAAADTVEGEMEEVTLLAARARRGLGELAHLYYRPAIPPRKLRRARATHAGHLPPGEEVAVLYDDTLFGDAEEGFLVTRRRFCWKNLTGRPEAVTWDGIVPASVSAASNMVHLGKGAVLFTAQRELPQRVAALLVALARELG